MQYGYISRVLLDRGIGFIVEDGGYEEVEFHWSALAGGVLDQLRTGQRVQFQTQTDHRDSGRMRAVNIRLIGAPGG